MKRWFSIFLSLVLVCGALVTPAKAVDYGWVNVLDFSTAFDSGSNRVWVNQGYPITYSLPGLYAIEHIDVVFTANRTINSVAMSYSDGTNAKGMTLQHITGNIYRAYVDFGSINSYSAIGLLFDFAEADCLISILSLRITELAVFQQDIEGYCMVRALGFSDTIHYVPTDDINARTWDGTTDYTNGYVAASAWVLDWTKYDYLDFVFYCSVGDISTVTATYNGGIIPCEVSDYENSSVGSNFYTISVRLDLRDVDRSAGGYPTVDIQGVCNIGESNSFAVGSIVGIFESDTVAADIYFLRNIWASIKAGFANVGTWISDQTTAISGFFTNLGATISEGFNNLAFNLQIHFSDLSLWIQNQTTAISGYFSSLEAKLEDLLSKDESSGDELKEELAQQETTLSEMTDVMESVTRPAVEDVDISIDSYVSQDDIILATQPLAVFLNNDIILTVLMMSLTMALGGYVMYGKR